MNGKGDSPRNCFSEAYRSNYDRIFKKPMKTTAYPRCRALGLRVFNDCVPFSDLNRIARKKGRRWSNRFDKLFGVQTVCADGMFAWDVEAVLERMASGKRTGTQLVMD